MNAASRNTRGWVSGHKKGLILIAGLAVVAAALTHILTRNTSGQAVTGAKDRKESASRVPVVLAPIAVSDFEECATVQGNVKAKSSAIVAARIAGVIDAVFVDEGDPVVANETRLFQTDALKLQKAVEISRQDLALADCGLKESEANLERVRAAYNKAEVDYRRYKRLYEEQKIVAADAYEQQEARYLQAQAELKYARTVVDLAAEKRKQAEAAIEIAEKNLADSLVLAPINGRVTQRLKEPGEMGEVGKTVLVIEDLSVVEIAAFLPAQHYARIAEGRTVLHVAVNGRAVSEQTVSYKSPTIDSRLRTFEIKAVDSSPGAGVVPGAMAEIRVVLDQRRGLSAPAESVQQRAGGSVVFLVEGGVARAVPVTTGLEREGLIEVFADRLTEGTPVVVMGQSFLSDGVPVEVSQATPTG